MSERIQYRTPDGLIHLWTQEMIDAYVASSLFIAEYPQVEQPMSHYDEALQTVRMLHDAFSHRHMALDHETVQDLLSRIDVMRDPLKEMVQALEVDRAAQNALPALRRLAYIAREEGGQIV